MLPAVAHAYDMDPGPLVGLTEIAMRAGVQKAAVSAWRTRNIGFPPSFQEMHNGPVWWWEPVRQWLKNTGRRTDANWTVEQVVPRKRGRSPQEIQQRFHQTKER